VARAGGFDLIGQRTFRSLWSANLLVTLSLAMLLLGAAWLMTLLTDNAILVSSVQTVISLPFVIFGVPFGIASDRFGHRTMLVVSQVWLLGVTGLMAVIALAGGWDFTPALLLSTLFLVGVGLVVQQTAWKPFLHDVAPADRIVDVISLNSLSNKISQSLGPILGGYLMGLAGAAALLFTRAAANLLMLVTVVRLPATGTAPSEKSRRSLRDGWRVLRGVPGLYGPIVRCALLMVPCGGVLALLPLEAKENIQTGAVGFGVLLAALGVGTTAGVSLMPFLLRRLPSNPLAAVALAVFALAVIGISQWDSMLLDAMFLLFFGFGWGALSISHQLAVHVSAPPEMRGLMTSIYALVLQGSMAVGSFGFGVIAHQFGVSRSILIAGVIALSSLSLVGVFRLPDAERVDQGRTA
jgi:MFS family permease